MSSQQQQQLTSSSSSLKSTAKVSVSSTRNNSRRPHKDDSADYSSYSLDNNNNNKAMAVEDDPDLVHVPSQSAGNDDDDDDVDDVEDDSQQQQQPSEDGVGGITSETPPYNFVMQPPKPAKGLTGKISTLFRREASKERKKHRRSNTSSASSTTKGPSPLTTSISSIGKHFANPSNKPQQHHTATATSPSSRNVADASTSAFSPPISPTTAAAVAAASAAVNTSSAVRARTTRPSSPPVTRAQKGSGNSVKKNSKRNVVSGTALVNAVPEDASLTANMPSSGRNDGNVGKSRNMRDHDGAGVTSTPSSVEYDAENDTTDVISVSSRASVKSRLFYSSQADDDSDDSYASKHSRKVTPRKKYRSYSSTSRSGASVTTGTSFTDGSVTNDDYDDRDIDNMDEADLNQKTILRYRGFSTSIQSLFLDEALVCASMGCFGLILSNRTEHLLQLRNERRGALSPRRSSSYERKKLPSRVVAYGLILTMMLMFSTFIIWGFGSHHTGLAATDYMNNGNGNIDGYDQDDYNKKNGVEWDDYLQNRNRNNDDGNKKDDYYAADIDDDYYNKQKNYNNYNSNYYKNYNKNNDDAQNKNDDGAAAQNDDANAQKNNDDANANAANDDNNKNQGGDDYYANDDKNRRLQDEINSDRKNNNYYREWHQPRGVFKIRDYQENLWNPICELVHDEWYRDGNDYDSETASFSCFMSRRRDQHSRRVDETYSGNSNRTQSYAQSASQNGRDIAGNIRIALLFIFLLFLGVLGRRRRMRTRYYLVRARAQEDHLFYASAAVGASRRVAFEDTREDQYEGACSHTLCGCYPADEVTPAPDENDEEVKVTDDGLFKVKRERRHQDFVARAFSCMMASCCGYLCKCWFQCLSVCALAQEAREIRLLVPPRYQRIDYITHQPFHEYQKNVNDLRRGWLGKTRRKIGIMPHIEALSRLSRYILFTSVIVISIIAATLCFNPRAAFSWQDAVVLLATFLQSFLVLFVVHWIFHKSDLSLDAVIKFFAAGFVIGVPSAFFFEALLVNTVLFVTWGVYEIFAATSNDMFVNWVFDHWRLIWIVGELFNAYIVAAVTEELCKYYTFRCVEHPDLIFLTGLNRNDHDENAVDGGLVKYPFASHQVSKLNRDSSFENESTSSRSHRSNKSSSKSKSSKEVLISRTGTRDDEFEEDEADARTYRQRAMAITTGMISVAVGLACAENCMYVFLLGGATGGNAENEDHHRGDVLEEWIVLFFRSIFPIHALAAAMQSINVIRKFVETDEHNGHRIGVGRIILPAVLVHGSFDAILMGINVFVETAWDKYLEANDGNVTDEEPYNALVVNLVAWISIIVIMMTGILWYYRQNRLQRVRLILLEQQDKVSLSDGENSGWNSTSQQNSELV